GAQRSGIDEELDAVVLEALDGVGGAQLQRRRVRLVLVDQEGEVGADALAALLAGISWKSCRNLSSSMPGEKTWSLVHGDEQVEVRHAERPDRSAEFGRSGCSSISRMSKLRSSSRQLQRHHLDRLLTEQRPAAQVRQLEDVHPELRLRHRDQLDAGHALRCSRLGSCGIASFGRRSIPDTTGRVWRVRPSSKLATWQPARFEGHCGVQTLAFRHLRKRVFSSVAAAIGFAVHLERQRAAGCVQKAADGEALRQPLGHVLLGAELRQQVASVDHVHRALLVLRPRLVVVVKQADVHPAGKDRLDVVRWQLEVRGEPADPRAGGVLAGQQAHRVVVLVDVLRHRVLAHLPGSNCCGPPAFSSIINQPEVGDERWGNHFGPVLTGGLWGIQFEQLTLAEGLATMGEAGQQCLGLAGWPVLSELPGDLLTGRGSARERALSSPTPTHPLPALLGLLYKMRRSGRLNRPSPPAQASHEPGTASSRLTKLFEQIDKDKRAGILSLVKRAEGGLPLRSASPRAKPRLFSAQEWTSIRMANVSVSGTVDLSLKIGAAQLGRIEYQKNTKRIGRWGSAEGVGSRGLPRLKDRCERPDSPVLKDAEHRPDLQPGVFAKPRLPIFAAEHGVVGVFAAEFAQQAGVGAGVGRQDGRHGALRHVVGAAVAFFCFLKKLAIFVFFLCSAGGRGGGRGGRWQVLAVGGALRHHQGGRAATLAAAALLEARVQLLAEVVNLGAALGEGCGCGVPPAERWARMCECELSSEMVSKLVSRRSYHIGSAETARTLLQAAAGREGGHVAGLGVHLDALEGDLLAHAVHHQLRRSGRSLSEFGAAMVPSSRSIRQPTTSPWWHRLPNRSDSTCPLPGLQSGGRRNAGARVGLHESNPDVALGHDLELEVPLALRHCPGGLHPVGAADVRVARLQHPLHDQLLAHVRRGGPLDVVAKARIVRMISDELARFTPDDGRVHSASSSRAGAQRVLAEVDGHRLVAVGLHEAVAQLHGLHAGLLLRVRHDVVAQDEDHLERLLRQAEVVGPLVVGQLAEGGQAGVRLVLVASLLAECPALLDLLHRPDLVQILGQALADLVNGGRRLHRRAVDGARLEVVVGPDIDGALPKLKQGSMRSFRPGRMASEIGLKVSSGPNFSRPWLPPNRKRTLTFAPRLTHG
uniref:EF-hand domain-containing protein n=1 Tax=Macrostomum lignano TaxID=282301 RepID=A0A1I8JR44_9PLAT